ncbi:MAG: type II and III secretion system protein family protein [Caulobacteraceae bacterium]
MSRTTLARLAAALAGCLALQGAPAAAQAISAMPAVTQTLVVAKDKSAAFRLNFPVGEVVVAQPDVLELVAVTDQSFYVRGKAVGVTNILVYDKQHRLAQVADVRVGLDTNSLQDDLAAALPGEHIQAVNFAGGVLLSGEASTLTAAQRAEAIAERYAPKAVSNQLRIDAAQQVMVEVRIIEVNRNALKDVGVNLNAHNTSSISFSSGQSGLLSNQSPQGTLNLSGHIGSMSIDATIQALEQKGLARTLAKPNLLAMSGEEASFLAGGEFPYPVPAGPQEVSIEFKPFGVKLNVTPEVEPNGMIKLKVSPEVSQLDPSNHLTIGGFDMPSLIERKASTTVELRDGQNLAIAGLFQQDYVNAVSQIPWASDVPVLGALFRSASWKRQETELVIIVTPTLTVPADSLAALPNPAASPDEPDEIALILAGHTFDQPIAKPVNSKHR